MNIRYLDENDKLHIFRSEDELADYLNNSVSNFSILSDYRVPAQKFLSMMKSLYKNIPKQKLLALKMMDEGGTYLIKFLKVDGKTIREMLCTRDFDKLQKDPNSGFVPPKGLSRKVNPHQVVVWDLGNDAFRSFRDSNLLDIRKISNDVIHHYNPKIKMTLEQFVDLLNNGSVNIIYKKMDDSTRLMKCTRKIPDFKDESEGSKLTVWDLDRADYRNIIFDRIQKINKINSISSSRVRDLFK